MSTNDLPCPGKCFRTDANTRMTKAFCWEQSCFIKGLEPKDLSPIILSPNLKKRSQTGEKFTSTPILFSSVPSKKKKNMIIS